jgi:hypothetical protein
MTGHRYAHAVIANGAAFIPVCPFPGCKATHRGNVRVGEPRRWAHAHGASFGWAVPHCSEGTGWTGPGQYWLGPDAGRNGQLLSETEMRELRNGIDA